MLLAVFCISSSRYHGLMRSVVVSFPGHTHILVEAESFLENGNCAFKLHEE